MALPRAKGSPPQSRRPSGVQRLLYPRPDGGSLFPQFQPIEMTYYFVSLYLLPSPHTPGRPFTSEMIDEFCSRASLLVSFGWGELTVNPYEAVPSKCYDAYARESVQRNYLK